jgi:type VI protein secretion system component VasF
MKVEETTEQMVARLLSEIKASQEHLKQINASKEEIRAAMNCIKPEL